MNIAAGNHSGQGLVSASWAVVSESQSPVLEDEWLHIDDFACTFSQSMHPLPTLCILG